MSKFIFIALLVMMAGCPDCDESIEVVDGFDMGVVDAGYDLSSMADLDTCPSCNAKQWWSFTKPALVGAHYTLPTIDDDTYISKTNACVNPYDEVAYASLLRSHSNVPIGLFAYFDRSVVGLNEWVYLTEVSDIGSGFSAQMGNGTCAHWWGRMRVITDPPNWSVEIDAACRDTGLEWMVVMGTMGGNE